MISPAAIIAADRVDRERASPRCPRPRPAARPGRRPRLAQAGRAIEVHLLVAVAGRREERAEALDRDGDQADLLVTLAHGRLLRVLARLEAARRQLPRPPADRVAVLADEHDLARVGDRNEHDRSRMPDDLRLERLAARQRDRLDVDGEDAALRRPCGSACGTTGLFIGRSIRASPRARASRSCRQRRRELHPPAVARMREREPRRVQERPLEPLDARGCRRARAGARRRTARRRRSDGRWRSGARESDACVRCESPPGRA